MFQFITSIDLSILLFIQNTFRTDVLDGIMAFFSYLGENGGIWIITSIILLCFRKTRATGVMILCAMAVGYIVGEIGIKHIVCRTRPFDVYPVQLNIMKPAGYSFPSGHSCSSFAAATVIFMQNKRFGISAFILAFLIAFSRLYNFVHYPTDVLCGIVLGVTFAIITVKLFKKYSLDKKLSGDLKYKKVN